MVKMYKAAGRFVPVTLFLFSFVQRKNELSLKHSVMKFTLRLFTFLLFFSLITLVAKSQQKHFIYVESEDKQPFAIVLNGKVYSSSDYGYIIISKLEDGDYNFTVSFPMNKF